jgi:soluble lytic murein transglycosylase
MNSSNFVKIALMPRILFLLLSILAPLTVVSSQDSPSLVSIRKSIELRDRAAGIAEMARFRAESPDAFFRDDLDYLMGRVASDEGRDGLAAANFYSVLKRRSDLSPYALKHFSQIARTSGNLMLESLLLTELAIESPYSLPAAGASIRMAKNRLESGVASEAIRILETVRSSDNKESAGSRETLALLGEAYMLSGDHSSARRIFTRLIDDMPAMPDDAALRSADALDRLDGMAGLDPRTPELSEVQHFQRAHIYTSNREFAKAKLHFEAILAKFPMSARSAEAAFQIGRGFAQQANFADALKWFERVLEQHPESAVAKDALAHAAAAYSRVEKPKESVTRYESYIAKYLSDEKLDRAYLNIVDVYRDQGEDTEALKWCGKVREVFRGKLPEAIATFTETRIHLARGEWENAVASLDRLQAYSALGGAAVPGGTNKAEVAFLRGFSLEQMKRYAEAIDVYLSIPDGRDEYYGWRATERLRSLSRDETARSFVDQKTGSLISGLGTNDEDDKVRAKAILRLSNSDALREKALAILKSGTRSSAVPGSFFKTEVDSISIKEPHNLSPEKLSKLGLFDEAAPELEYTSRVTGANRLALYYNRGNHPNRGLSLVESTWKKVPVDQPLEILPRDQLELLYPAPHADALIKYTRETSVDPRFLLAIMRQESRFDPNAKSSAGARGLMQFIATTSDRIAGQLDRESFRQDDLYDPATAILFGAKYSSELFTRFPDQPEAVAASYNGGDDNMARWLSRARSNLSDRYVSEIVYSQTKDYVYKVMANYRVYQFLYDERLRPRKE